MEGYCTYWDAQRAAIDAGYSEATAKAKSYQFIKRPEIQEAISARLRYMAMGADEALKRLADQARINPTEFYTVDKVISRDINGVPILDSEGNPKVETRLLINWEAVFSRGHLIKGIEYDRRGNVVLKFYDAQSALALIGKNLKLFSEVIDINAMGLLVKAYVGISPDDWDEAPQAEENEPSEP